MTCCCISRATTSRRSTQTQTQTQMVVPPHLVVDKVCPLLEDAGNDIPVAYRLNVTGVRGTMEFVFTSYTVPDRARIFIDGVMVVDTGCIGTSDGYVYDDVIHESFPYQLRRIQDRSVPASPFESTIYVENNREVIVEVLANCVGDMNITASKGTAWVVNLLCADTASPKVDFSLPDPFKNVYHIGKARLSDGTSKPTGRTLRWTNPVKEV